LSGLYFQIARGYTGFEDVKTIRADDFKPDFEAREECGGIAIVLARAEKPPNPETLTNCCIPGIMGRVGDSDFRETGIEAVFAACLEFAKPVLVDGLVLGRMARGFGGH
jgi:hypothetical protein